VNGQEIMPLYVDNLGYHIYYKVLNTVDYGIPQQRQRIFIVGLRERADYRFPSKQKLDLKLSDLLEQNPDEKYFMSQKAYDFITKPFRIKKGYTQINGDIALTITAKANSNWTGDFIVGYTRSTKTGEITSRHPLTEANTIHASTGGGGNTDQFVLCNNGTRIRKLTPLECFRLQGFPDWFDKTKCSDSQLYKQAGNSMSIPPIQEIIRNIKPIFHDLH